MPSKIFVLQNESQGYVCRRQSYCTCKVLECKTAILEHSAFLCKRISSAHGRQGYCTWQEFRRFHKCLQRSSVDKLLYYQLLWSFLVFINSLLLKSSLAILYLYKSMENVSSMRISLIYSMVGEYNWSACSASCDCTALQNVPRLEKNL